LNSNSFGLGLPTLSQLSFVQPLPTLYGSPSLFGSSSQSVGHGMLEFSMAQLRTLDISGTDKEHPFTRKIDKIKLPVLNTKEIPFFLWLDTVLSELGFHPRLQMILQTKLFVGKYDTSSHLKTMKENVEFARAISNCILRCLLPDDKQLALACALWTIDETIGPNNVPFVPQTFGLRSNDILMSVPHPTDVLSVLEKKYAPRNPTYQLDLEKQLNLFQLTEVTPEAFLNFVARFRLHVREMTRAGCAPSESTKFRALSSQLPLLSPCNSVCLLLRHSTTWSNRYLSSICVKQTNEQRKVAAELECQRWWQHRPALASAAAATHRHVRSVLAVTRKDTQLTSASRRSPTTRRKFGRS
jgi:hypothetical protein